MNNPPTVEQIVSSYRHLDNVSEEQAHICNSIQQGKNVIVDACAGSGKSTTVLSTCRIMPETNFLILTYNRALRHETQEKIRHLNIKNAEVHTYHSLAVAYYSSLAHTDNKLMDIINNDNKLIKTPKRDIDIIVIDEAQDMSRLYYDIVQKFTKDLNREFQLLVLGDYRQGLYEFKGSDIRYLTHSEHLWKNNQLLKNRNEFVYATLKTTYRLTNQMASFVNNVLLGEKRLHACRDGPPVGYYVLNIKQIKLYVFGFIDRIISENNAKYDDIFILTPSVRNSLLIREIENELVSHNVPCHIPLIEDSEMDERVIENKVVFCTFHSSKGRQRKYVIVLNFDNTYFDYNARNKPRTICPNTIYVATTRATHEMYIFEQTRYSKNENPQISVYPFDFLKMTHDEMKKCENYIRFYKEPANVSLYVSPKEGNEIYKPHTYRTSPTELTKFLSYQMIELLFPLVNDIFTLEVSEQHEIFIPNIIQTLTGYEDVSDLNGVVIPMIYYDSIYNSNAKVLRDIITNNYINNKNRPESVLLKQRIQNIPKTCNNPESYLYIANIVYSLKTKLFFRLKQINEDGYGWLTPDIINKTNERLNGIISNKKNIKIEETIITYSDDEDYSHIDKILTPVFGKNVLFRFTAILDLLTDNTIWELKCTNDITFEHKIQVIVYAWLWKLTYEKTTTKIEEPKSFRILNIKSGDIWVLNASLSQLTDIMIILLKRLIITTDEETNTEEDDLIFIKSHEPV